MNRLQQVALAVSLGAVGSMACSAESRTAACAALTGLKFSEVHASVQKAVWIPAGAAPAEPGATAGPQLPAHCRVEGVIDPRKGRNGRDYAIGFAVSLPQEWNGRFLFQGGGGLNGTLLPPLGAAAAGDRPALARGFAVASTDSGHKGAGFDGTFLEDQIATLNFLYQGVARSTVAAKQVVTAYYAKPADRSYFVGCSTGGREAMMMSQRFPDYYDGIVAGAPAMRTSYSNLATRWVTASLNAVAPKDAQGRSQTDRALSTADRKLVVDGLLKACDALDGQADGLIFDVKNCRFDPAELACKGPKTASCLTTAQTDAIRKGFAGPHTRAGIAVYTGFPYDTGISSQGRGIPGLLNGGMSMEGPAPTGAEMDVDAQATVAHDGRSMAGDSNAWTNLSGFNGKGGKLVFFHGVSDPWFSAFDTIQYYERLEKDNAPLVLRDWSRLYLVPGMGHCRGGDRTLDRFDLLSPTVEWVEKGKAPEGVVATGDSLPGRSRPLCPWPEHAQYQGSGNAEDARNYSCAKR
ncbi:MAG: tannase/feruloyl esterase family alpha/beta hydrolase [Steroidobacteraceae bacterium]